MRSLLTLEFWHGYGWSEDKKEEFKTNREFWVNKIERNIKRDKEVNEALEQQDGQCSDFGGMK